MNAFLLVCVADMSPGDCLALLGLPVPTVATDFQKLEAERLDLAEGAEEGCLVWQPPREHGLTVTLCRVQSGEGGEQRLPEVPSDAYLAL